MVAVHYPAVVALDPSSELLAGQGLVGQVVAAGTSTPLTITEDKDGLVPIVDAQLAVTSQSLVPGFWCQDGTVEAEWVSGEYRIPMYSMTGLQGAADDAALAAQASADQAAANVQAAADVAAQEAVDQLVTDYVPRAEVGTTVENLALNPSVGASGTGWGVAQTSTMLFEVSTTQGLYGGYCVRAVFTGPVSDPINTGIFYGRSTVDDIRIVPGRTYPFSIYVQSSIAQLFCCGLRFFDESGAAIGGLLYGPAHWVPADEYQRLAYVTIPPPGAVRARIYAIVPSGGSPWAEGDRIYADAASTAPGEYFDGDTPGATWLGDPGASVSQTARLPLISIGPDEPQGAPAGAEFVWFKTDGNGGVIDILSGIGA